MTLKPLLVAACLIFMANDAVCAALPSVPPRISGGERIGPFSGFVGNLERTTLAFEFEEPVGFSRLVVSVDYTSLNEGEIFPSVGFVRWSAGDNVLTSTAFANSGEVELAAPGVAGLNSVELEAVNAQFDFEELVVTTVPLPATLALFASAVGVLGAWRAVPLARRGSR